VARRDGEQVSEEVSVLDWLVVDRRNPQAVEAAERLRVHLGDWSPPEPLRAVVGGDGFLLRTVAAQDFEGVFLGLNTGNLGFLHNDAADDWAGVAERLMSGRFTTHDFPLLSAQVQMRDHTSITALAMNDVYLERATGQAARLALTVDGHPVVDMIADGLIVATALGSTAYSFSAGGSPSHPLLHVLKVTPICPHLPRLTPFSLPASARVRVDVLLEDRRPVRAVVDGQALEEVRSVQIGFSQERVRLAYFEDHDFMQHLLEKIVIP